MAIFNDFMKKIFVISSAVLFIAAVYGLYHSSQEKKEKEITFNAQRFKEIRKINKLLLLNVHSDSVVSFDHYAYSYHQRNNVDFISESCWKKIDNKVDDYGLIIWGSRNEGILYDYEDDRVGFSLKLFEYKAYLFFEGDVTKCPKLDWMIEVKSLNRISGPWYKVVYQK